MCLTNKILIFTQQKKKRKRIGEEKIKSLYTLKKSSKWK